MDILVTYDIDTTSTEGERRFLRVARVCEGYGVRAQYSVFECRVSELSLEHLKAALEGEMDRSSDSINIYRFTGTIHDARLCLGRAKGHRLGEPWLL